MKTLALRARVFIHCFLVFGYPGETLALVVHILHKAPLIKHYTLYNNKTLYRALTRWGYTNTHITVYDTYRLQYTATVFQLRFKVVPELSGKVEYERERLNTVQKCNLVP